MELSDDERRHVRLIFPIIVGKALCNYCFESQAEFRKWSGGQEMMAKDTAWLKKAEFWSYATEHFSEPCVRVKGGDYCEEDPYICLECLTEMVEKLAKESGELVFVEWVRT